MNAQHNNLKFIRALNLDGSLIIMLVISGHAQHGPVSFIKRAAGKLIGGKIIRKWMTAYCHDVLMS